VLRRKKEGETHLAQENFLKARTADSEEKGPPMGRVDISGEGAQRPPSKGRRTISTAIHRRRLEREKQRIATLTKDSCRFEERPLDGYSNVL